MQTNTLSFSECSVFILWHKQASENNNVARKPPEKVNTKYNQVSPVIQGWGNYAMDKNSSKDTEFMGMSQGTLMCVQPSDVTNTNKLNFLPPRRGDQKAPRYFPGIEPNPPNCPSDA